MAQMANKWHNLHSGSGQDLPTSSEHHAHPKEPIFTWEPDKWRTYETALEWPGTPQGGPLHGAGRTGRCGSWQTLSTRTDTHRPMSMRGCCRADARKHSWEPPQGICSREEARSMGYGRAWCRYCGARRQAGTKQRAHCGAVPELQGTAERCTPVILSAMVHPMLWNATNDAHQQQAHSSAKWPSSGAAAAASLLPGNPCRSRHRRVHTRLTQHPTGGTSQMQATSRLLFRPLPADPPKATRCDDSG